MDRGAWRATVHGVAKSRTQLSHFTFTFTLRFPEAHKTQGQLREPGVPQTEKGPDPRRLEGGIKGAGGGKAGDREDEPRVQC